jgi:sec-independent protein translocase protein TatC
MTFLEHLEELRKRLFNSVIAVLIAFCVCCFFAKKIFYFVALPLTAALGSGKKLAYMSLAEPFTLYMKIAFVAAIFLSAPCVIYQLWLFISPGLFPRERGYAFPFIFFATLFFLLGGFFGYRVVFPTLCKFFLSVGEDFDPVLRINDYFSLFSKTLLGIAVVFEMPVLIFFLAKLGIITHTFMLKKWRWAIVIIFIIAAVLTPTPDMATQAAVAFPMLGLYFLSIGVAYFFGKKRNDAETETPESGDEKPE